MRRFGFALGVVSLVAACSADPGPTGPVPSVVIENASQYELRELRIHSESDYMKSPNRLEDVLALSAELVFYGDGRQYVTVFREKYAGGPILAFTTMSPLSLSRGSGYRLLVFDESFRLTTETYLDPKDVDVPIIGTPGE